MTRNLRQIRKVQAVEKAKVCPGVRFFRTRTKKKWFEEVVVTTKVESLKSWEREPRRTVKFRYGPYPALAARIRPRPKKGPKKVDIVESYDFATALLDVEVHYRHEADPFTDPRDDELSYSSSARVSVLDFFVP